MSRKLNSRIKAVRHLGDYRLALTFSDGSTGDVDLESRVVGRGGVFLPLANVEFFAHVAVDPEAGTIVWPNGVDLCPEVLFCMATGRPIPEPALQG